MEPIMIGFIAIISTLVYTLIGWFVRSLIQDDWEEPSLLLTILWPLVLVMTGLVKLFMWVEDLATKIKEKNDV